MPRLPASLTALFKHIGSTDDRNAEDLSAWEGIREKVLCFIRDKVFPLKAELLKPKDEMERHITNLVKQVSDGDHIDRFISCLQMALPFFMRGASSSKFFNYLTKQIIPVFDKLPEERKLDLLKNLAECSHYAKPQDSRQLLPSVVQLLKKYMVRRKIEEINFISIECLLYAFHHLAHKTPNATNSLCGYKIVTGQPSDRLGEDFSEQYKDFTERLSTIEELSKAMNKKLTQGMAEHNKAMAAAKTDEEKETIPLHSKAPSFIGDQKINLSWKEVTKPVTSGAAATTGQKRAANGSGSNVTKKGRGAGGLQNQLVNRAFEGLTDARSGGRGGRVDFSSFPHLVIIIFLHKWCSGTLFPTRKYVPPSPRKLPMIGNLHQIVAYPHRSLWSLSNRYGELILLQFGCVPTLVVSSAEAAREIMKNQDAIFSNRPRISIPDRLVYGSREVVSAKSFKIVDK
ncbi:cytochrome p450 71a3 [Phtheirospermum japonicum]|uniref:Cytochrome p450 71a3 n=1 Tax=Phtheirospermum japonicum TaxID=374723 RepID=A0A830B0B5_9LAMI|nr:cytochrome p450 71a3 [Phtheirospermum japonicum]